MRQGARLQDLVAVQVRQRHLGRRHEPEVVLDVVVEVVAELGQLAGAPEALLLDDERRIDLRVALLCVCRSSIQAMSARSSRAPAPLST